MAPDPPIAISCDYLVVVSDDSLQPASADNEVIILGSASESTDGPTEPPNPPPT